MPTTTRAGSAPLDAVIAANRFGLGARPDELAVIKSDPKGWLRAQLIGSRPVPEKVAALSSSAVIFQQQAQAIRERRDAKRDAAAERSPEALRESITAAVVAAQDELRDIVRGHYLAQVQARYQLAVHSPESFRERLIHFWTNHFAVSADKPVVAALAGTLEQEAIRPHVHGRFVDMLLAVESHPAMILYLDNQASTGPNSTLASLQRKRNERRGDADKPRKLDINENLGREILELHTLGVEGGYTQTDVTRFATVLTGWSVGGDPNGAAARLGALTASAAQGEPGRFVFRDALHEPGAQTILGKRYVEAGIEQPQAVLRDLAAHPATARHLATKLARHFIADEPPAAAIERLARVYQQTEGDLPSVHAALLDGMDAWDSTARKLKTPHEFVVSALRALDQWPDKPQQVLAPFELLGQRPFTPGSPAGWADRASQWDGPDALMKRIEWATQVGQRLGSRRTPELLAQQSLATALGEHSLMAIRNAADAAQGIVLWLMSPEFQRR